MVLNLQPLSQSKSQHWQHNWMSVIITVVCVLHIWAVYQYYIISVNLRIYTFIILDFEYYNRFL